MISKILVPVDGSDSSRVALELACELGKKQGPRFVFSTLRSHRRESEFSY